MEFTTGFELQSQATRLRWTAFTRRNKIPGEKTGLSPSPVPCSKGIYPGPPPGTPGTTPRRDWQHGLFPLQSPLLRESWLVSFPPLNYMLKFSGSSCVHQVQGKSLDGTSDSVSLVGASCDAMAALEVLPNSVLKTKWMLAGMRLEPSRWRWCLVTDLPHPHRTRPKDTRSSVAMVGTNVV